MNEGPLFVSSHFEKVSGFVLLARDRFTCNQYAMHLNCWLLNAYRVHTPHGRLLLRPLNGLFGVFISNLGWEFYVIYPAQRNICNTTVSYILHTVLHNHRSWVLLVSMCRFTYVIILGIIRRLSAVLHISTPSSTISLILQAYDA